MFGLAEFRFADTWKLTFEARFSDEKETVGGVNCALAALPAGSLGPGSPAVPCNDPSLAGQSVFGPSVNLLYPYFGTLQYFAPMAPAGTGVGVVQAPGTPVTLSSSHAYATPRVTLEAKPWEDALVYLTWARGVKPGGISTVTAGPAGRRLRRRVR